MNGYSVTLGEGLRAVDPRELDKALRTLRRSVRVFVCGNGGSASIADHWACDMLKGLSGHAPPSVVSLTAHTGLLTAIANDIAYEAVFEEQLHLHVLTPRDCVVCISASGNSPNVLRAAAYASSVRAPVLGFTGFDGGELRRVADARLHVPVSNYGIVEDAHQALMHALSQFWHRSGRKTIVCGAV